jgi:hypothetical protein
MGADSLVTVSTVIQQSITGVAHVRLPFVDPALDLIYRPQGRWKSVLKCGAQGFGLALELS